MKTSRNRQKEYRSRLEHIGLSQTQFFISGETKALLLEKLNGMHGPKAMRFDKLVGGMLGD